jgi:hypothetical protein
MEKANEGFEKVNKQLAKVLAAFSPRDKGVIRDARLIANNLARSNASTMGYKSTYLLKGFLKLRQLISRIIRVSNVVVGQLLVASGSKEHTVRKVCQGLRVVCLVALEPVCSYVVRGVARAEDFSFKQLADVIRDITNEECASYRRGHHHLVAR